MPRKAKKIILSAEESDKLRTTANKRTSSVQEVQRAKIILLSSEEKLNKEIAKELSLKENTVGKWRNRFAKSRMAGLKDDARPGKPRKYDESFRNKILLLLDKEPPDGFAKWDAVLLAKEMNCKPEPIWEVLKKEGIQLKRKRSWCVSTDPEFTVKSADIVGLYINPPENVLVISLDEKPSIQAIERQVGYIKSDCKKITRAYQSTYKRNGTLNLFAALNIATGTVKGKTTQRKKREDFLEFMDEIVEEMPPRKEIHVILDNYCTHKKCDKWLEEHPNVHFHFTPTSASWLNQVEIWFSIFSRKTLDGASFKSTEDLAKAIHSFIEVYNSNPRPFKWRKREVKGSQIKNTITNLAN